MTDVNSNGVPAAAPCLKNPLTIWVRAGRLWSLPASVAPIVSALVLAWKDLSIVKDEKFLILPAVCCFFFAVLGHISANLMNDYSDYRTGANGTVREKRERELRVTKESLLIGGLSAFACAVIFGLATIPFGGMTIIVAGIITGAICLLYSVGPFPFSEWGLGDVAVILTFGMSSVVFTYFLQTGKFPPESILLGFAYGMAINNLLIANNFGDTEEDKSIKKYTTIVLFGETFGRLFYITEGFLGAAALAGFYFFHGNAGVLPVLVVLLYLVMHILACVNFISPKYQRAVGIAQSGRNVTLLGVLIPLSILL